MTTPYDPLDYTNLARSVVDALLNANLSPLPPARFDGSGVYAIYYTASLEYDDSESSEDVPLYVGKAEPPGGRRGSGAIRSSRNASLYNRLRQHARSIEQAENLSLEFARCRYLVVEPVWIGLAEQFLINHFQPIWNTVLDGFGNHDPGRGRRNSARPRWDIMHPGRSWASTLRANETQEEILEGILNR